jgi:hypothetical protein
VVLLGPHPPQRAHRLKISQVHRYALGFELGQELEAVRADPLRQLLPLGVAPGKPVLLHARAVALVPLRGRPTPEPLRSHGGQGVQGRPERLAYALEAPHRLDRGQHVRRVGTLFAARLEEAASLAFFEQLLQQRMLGPALQQPRAELAQNGEVEAGVFEFQAEGVLPVDARAHGVGGLPVREALGELHHAHQDQPPRGQGRLPAPREEAGEVLVLPHDPQLVPHPSVGRPLREGGQGHAGGLFGNGANGLGAQGDDLLRKVGFSGPPRQYAAPLTNSPTASIIR